MRDAGNTICDPTQGQAGEGGTDSQLKSQARCGMLGISCLTQLKVKRGCVVCIPGGGDTTSDSQLKSQARVRDAGNK